MGSSSITKLTVEDREPTLSADDRESIQRAVEQICAHPAFRNSERSSKLLRFLVEAALKGEHARLKERAIGHELFGRSADYETSADPVVRNASSEVRKRLAQYYQSNSDAIEVRIQLTPGSYVPRFEMVSSPETRVIDEAASAVPAPIVIDSVSAHRFNRQSMWIIALSMVIAAFVLFHVSQFLRTRAKANAVTRFWGPLFNSDQDTLISLGDGTIGAGVHPSPEAASVPFMAIVDAKSYAWLASLVDAHHRPSRVLTANATELSDLRDHPAILIGAFNNPWTLRVTSGLRYRFGQAAPSGYRPTWIEDSRSSQKWSVAWQPESFTKTTVDYALAGRVRNQETGDVVYFVGGAGTHATEAAAQFLTEDKYLNKLPKRLADPNVNIEVLLKVDVVNGSTGSPEILAMEVW